MSFIISTKHRSVGTSRQRCACFKAQRNCSLPPTACSPGWPHRGGVCCHLEKALKDEFLRGKLALSGGCFCRAFPAVIHQDQKWRSGILPSSAASFSDVTTLTSHPAVAKFPLTVFYIDPLQFLMMWGEFSLSSHTRWCSPFSFMMKSSIL